MLVLMQKRIQGKENRAARRTILYGCLLTLVLLAGCSMVKTLPFEPFRDDGNPTLTIWALSDIHPRTEEERRIFENAIEDANTLGTIDIGIMAGDLLKSRSREEAFDWFVQTRSRSDVADWFVIAGNHDARSQPLFAHYFPDPPYYGVAVGNMLILLLSDVSVSSRTDISEDGFLWWRKMVLENQDKIIVTVTHAQLQNSGLFGSFAESRTIADSGMFENVLKKARVALWLSGHSHLPQGLAGTVSIRKEFNGTCFVNVSSISEEAFLDSQSRFLLLSSGSKKMWIRSRNHRFHYFEPNLDIPIELDKPFIWDGASPELILPASS